MHTNVSDACAFQVQCNADAAFNLSGGGYNWSPWVTYNSKAWGSYISTAEGAVYGYSVTLKNNGDGTCLDADSTSVGNGGKIFQWTCSTSDAYQQWWFYGSGQLNTNGNANAGVHSVGTGTTCLDADGSARGDGAPIFQWTCKQSDIYQQWN